MSREYFNYDTNVFGPSPRVDAFLKDLLLVYEKHGLSLGHEDTHGAFIVYPLVKTNVDWLSAAMVAKDVGEDLE